MIHNNHIQQNRLNIIYFFKAEIHRLLLTSVGFSFLLLLARIIYTGNITFAFLVWNLFLAFVPYFLSYFISLRTSWINRKWKFVVACAAWLIFIPNSFYILTDLFHLYDSKALPRWYDLLLIVSFAWNALFAGILSVRHMEKIIASLWPLPHDWLFVYPVMWLNALGVYIGRYLRYNSWDVISNPFALTRDIILMMMHPVRYKEGWVMIVCFSFFLTIFFQTIKKLGKAIW